MFSTQVKTTGEEKSEQQQVLYENYNLYNNLKLKIVLFSFLSFLCDIIYLLCCILLCSFLFVIISLSLFIFFLSPSGCSYFHIWFLFLFFTNYHQRGCRWHEKCKESFHLVFLQLFCQVCFTIIFTSSSCCYYCFTGPQLLQQPMLPLVYKLDNCLC